jgi:hypothetical protein
LFLHGAVEYISKLHHLITFCVRILLVSVVYMAFMFRSHRHIYNVTNLIIMIIF